MIAQKNSRSSLSSFFFYVSGNIAGKFSYDTTVDLVCIMCFYNVPFCSYMLLLLYTFFFFIIYYFIVFFIRAD